MNQPNILFIFADDWGYGDLGCYGHPDLKTPNLDKLASEGTKFKQFHVTSGVCSPSRCSVITGHYPARHRVHGHFARYDLNESRDMPNWLDPDIYTLPALLQDAGYRTAHYGKWHLGGGGGIHGHPDAPMPEKYGYDDTRVWNGNGPTWHGTEHWPFALHMDVDMDFLPHSSELSVNEAINFISQDSEKPFFVNLWLWAPHTPLVPTEEQRKPYKEYKEPEQTYYSVITDADAQIGRLLDKLDELNLRNDTLVIFSSDNGPENIKKEWGTAGSTAGLRGRKRSLYEGGVRTPFIVRWPGETPVGETDDSSLLSGVDILPTFCQIAGAEMPDDLDPDGVDMTSALIGESFERAKPLMWEWLFADPDPESIQCPELAIREGNWELLVNPDIGRKELYNIKNDCQQKNNLAEEYPELVEILYRHIRLWKKELP